MREEWKSRFYNAIEPLTWDQEEGDDGDRITLALDEIASLFKELPSLAEVESDDLPGLLRAASVPEDNIASVERLAELGGSDSAYGGGMSKESAREATDITQDVVPLLEEFMEKHFRKRKRAIKRTKGKQPAGAKHARQR